jgi:4a-hydroxytetrahydrobiopterin dehydratase
LLGELQNDWRVGSSGRLEKEYRLHTFRDAMAFAGQIADLVEAEQYHPDLLVSWGKLRVTLPTHSARGLSENDFILAGKVDALPREAPARGLA